MRKFVCDDASYNAETGECTAPQWVPDTGLLPALSVEGAFAIASAVAALWAIAWVFKQFRR